MAIVILALLIFGFVCFLLAAFSVPSPPRLNLIALGLAFWILSVLIQSHPVALR